MNSNGKKPETQNKPKKNVEDQSTKRPVKPAQKQFKQEISSTSQRPAAPKRALQKQTPNQGNGPQRKPSGLSDNLRSQTPLQRQMRRQNAPREPGTVRRTNKQYFKISQGDKKRPKRERKKTNTSFAKRVLILGAIGYVILLPIAILIASLLLKANVITSTDDFRYQLGEGKNTLSRKTYSYSRVCRDGVYYIDMDSVADYCKLTTTGDGKNMRYVVRESSESVEFILGESIAYINGVPERTGGNAFIYAGRVHIPLEFAKRCFLNLDITLDTEMNRITIVRKSDDKGNYLALDFPYKLVGETDKIVFGQLDVDIQEQIIKQNQPVIPEEEGNDDTQVNN